MVVCRQGECRPEWKGGRVESSRVESDVVQGRNNESVAGERLWCGKSSGPWRKAEVVVVTRDDVIGRSSGLPRPWDTSSTDRQDLAHTITRTLSFSVSFLSGGRHNKE